MLYEYVGFKFIIDEENGKAVAMPFQHKAAYKEKHARNAYSQYVQEKENA
jgi:hypothetical protein